MVSASAQLLFRLQPWLASSGAASDALEIPIVKMPATDTEDAKLSRIVEYLVSRGGQRPGSVKTLVG